MGAHPRLNSTDGLPADLRRLLRRAPPFAELSEKALAQAARAGAVLTVRRGRTLFLEGDPGDGLYVALDGLMRIWVCDPEGAELTLGLIEPGDVFGEAAILDGAPRTASATALCDSVLFRLPARAATALIDAEPSFARGLLGAVSERLRQANDDRRAAAFLDLGGRLARRLTDLAFAAGSLEGGGARIEGVSQTDLAAMLGVTREAVNKRLRRLAAGGLVRIERGALVLPDLAALEAEAT